MTDLDDDMETSNEFSVMVGGQEIKGPKMWLVYVIGPNHELNNLDALMDEVKNDLDREPNINLIIVQVSKNVTPKQMPYTRNSDQ